MNSHSSSHSRKVFAALLVSFAATATGAFGCSSSNPAAPTETFTDVYTTILQPKCASCHAAGAPDKFMDLSTQAAAFQSLVGVSASGPACSGKGTRVVAGDANDSLLFQKVSEAKPSCGVQMPYNGPPYLSAADQTKIETWINDGALND